MRVTIRWRTRDRALVRRICETIHAAHRVTVNGLTEADVTPSELEWLRRGEPEYLTIINTARQ